MIIIAVVSYRTKLESAIKYFKSYKSKEQTNSKLPENLKSYIVIMLLLMGLLTCLMVVIIRSYLGVF